MIKSQNLAKLVAVMATSLASLLSPVFAQTAPAITDTKTSGAWTVRCIRAQTEVCELAQFVVQKNRNVKIAGIEINYVAKSDAYLGRFSVPLGVSFDQGLGLEVGTFRAAGLKYRICENDGCYVTGMLPTELLTAMKDTSTEKGFMDIQMIDGRKGQIPITLNGFSEGLDLLKKWTLAKAASPDKPAK